MSEWGRRPMFDRKGNYPCKDCNSRTVGCHSFCKLFLEEKERAEKVGEEIKQRRAKESMIGDYIIDRMIHIHNEVYHGECKRWES